MAEKYARQLVTKTNFAVDNNKIARHYLELSTILGLLKKYGEGEGHAQKAQEVLSNISEKTYLDNVELAKAHLLLATFALVGWITNLPTMSIGRHLISIRRINPSQGLSWTSCSKKLERRRARD